MFDALLPGLAASFAPINLAYITLGLLVGFAVGVLPGLNRSAAVAIAIPISFYLPPVTAISFLIGIAKGGASGGAVTAILVNTPGEPSSAATCLDGYPLARQGKAGKALKVALIGGFVGDAVATVVLIAVAQPIASVAIRVGPFEAAAILIFALTFIAALSGSSMAKGLMAGCLGILFGCVGVDIETGGQRLTFGWHEIADGIPLVAVGLGMFALAEMLGQIEEKEAAAAARVIAAAQAKGEGDRVTAADLRTVAPVYMRSTTIGILVGILPGIGGTVASFMAYATEKRIAREPERFGRGAIEGVAAAETADNANVPAALVPLFALGIPGSNVAALLIGAFMVHGIAPGPMMFEKFPQVVAGIYVSMLVAAVLMLAIGWFIMGLLARLARLPASCIVPPVLGLCLIGAYLEGSGMSTVYLMVGFGLLGFLMRKVGMSIIAFVVGFVLAPEFERSLRQAVSLSSDNPWQALDHPVALLFVGLAVAASALFVVSHRRLERRLALLESRSAS